MRRIVFLRMRERNEEKFGYIDFFLLTKWGLYVVVALNWYTPTYKRIKHAFFHRFNTTNMPLLCDSVGMLQNSRQKATNT